MAGKLMSSDSISINKCSRQAEIMDFMQNKAMRLLDHLVYFLQKSARRQGPLYGIMDNKISA